MHPVAKHNNNKKRVLVAPLDWGLGHTTRCIPIIRYLLANGAEVILAGNPSQQSLLAAEFPHLTFLPLKGYNARYAKTKLGLLMGMITQSFRFFRTIKQENKWLNEKIDGMKIDAVISDNRFGLYHPNIPCIFITHQLNIKSPLGKWSENLLQRTNYKYINRFTTCWVPDVRGEENLAGELSHPQKLPSIPVSYIGLLSRFEKREIDTVKNHLLILLSGPEPQRSIFENIIIKELSFFSGTATIVRGLPTNTTSIPSSEKIKFYNHLPAEMLNAEMIKAEIVVSRCGYSTLMDMAVLNKRGVLIPTPGQTEQEYLAKKLKENKWAYTVAQSHFSLENAIVNARGLEKTLAFSYNDNELGETIRSFVHRLIPFGH